MASTESKHNESPCEHFAPAPKRGVFWVIEGELQAYPFEPGATEGVAKSGNTYNHKLLWETLGISSKPYNYYPRGRVELDSKGRAVIYLHPSIATEAVVDQVVQAFGLSPIERIIKPDYSKHYQCYLENG